MSLDSRSRSRSRSRSPMDRKMHTQRYAYHDAPYRRIQDGTSVKAVCARTANGLAILPENAPMWPFATIVVFLECTTKSLCWNCREPGHMAGNCPNLGICHTCGQAGHRARDCTAPPPLPGDLRLCSNCFKQGYIAAECINDKACKNCMKTGHIARDRQNEPVCNLCNISGHVARDRPKGNMLDDRGVGFRGGGFRDIVCRNCRQAGYMSRDCISMTICHNCGGRGHLAFECPSGRFMDRFPRRY